MKPAVLDQNLDSSSWLLVSTAAKEMCRSATPKLSNGYDASNRCAPLSFHGGRLVQGVTIVSGPQPRKSTNIERRLDREVTEAISASVIGVSSRRCRFIRVPKAVGWIRSGKFIVALPSRLECAGPYTKRWRRSKTASGQVLFRLLYVNLNRFTSHKWPQSLP